MQQTWKLVMRQIEPKSEDKATWVCKTNKLNVSFDTLDRYSKSSSETNLPAHI